jgi:hypothetical protein
MKIAFDAMAQHFDRTRLGKTGRAFHEQVTVTQQHHEHAIQQTLLPDDEMLQVGLELQKLFL